MDFIINFAKNLDSTDLWLILGIVAFIAFIILLIIKATILQLGIRILTKKRVAFYYMIIPTTLSMILNIILLFVTYLILSVNNIDIIEIAFQYLFKNITDYTNIIYILIAFLASQIVFWLVQAFILKLITFDIVKSIKKLYCKLAKKEYIEKDLEEPETTHLTYINGLLSGLFCFAIIFFLCIFLVYIGELLGRSYIRNVK